MAVFSEPEALLTYASQLAQAHKREALVPSPAALDDVAAARLWAESEALVTRAGV
jgi:hypothetical protein